MYSIWYALLKAIVSIVRVIMEALAFRAQQKAAKDEVAKAREIAEQEDSLSLDLNGDGKLDHRDGFRNEP